MNQMKAPASCPMQLCKKQAEVRLMTEAGMEKRVRGRTTPFLIL